MSKSVELIEFASNMYSNRLEILNLSRVNQKKKF